MKTILGKLVSMQPISLSKAARYISDFSSFENNGASEVVSVYLNRTSEAFSSLVQLHKDLKHPQSSRKKQRKTSRDGSLRTDETVNNYDDEKQDRGVGGVIEEEDGSVRVGGKSKKGKEMQKKESIKPDDSVRGELRKGSSDGGNVEVQNMENGVVDQTKKKRKRKKKENENTEEGSKMDIDDGGSKGGENGSELRIEKAERKDEEKKIKKRKEENKIEEAVTKGKPEVEQGKKNKKNKREEIEMKEVGREVKLDVGQEKESKKKKRKSEDLDDEVKENLVVPPRRSKVKSKVVDD